MKYNLYNEDCIEVMRNMPEGSIDLVCTDPPYLIPKTTGGGTCNKAIHLSKALDNLKPLGIHKGYNIDFMAQEIDRIQGATSTHTSSATRNSSTNTLPSMWASTDAATTYCCGTRPTLCLHTATSTSPTKSTYCISERARGARSRSAITMRGRCSHPRSTPWNRNATRSPR